jgi:type I restriction enzyme S subunit
MDPHSILDRFELLIDTPGSIPKLRQFILELAMQGRLTTRREEDTRASKLLNPIKEEKERLYEEGEIRKSQAKLPEKADGPYSLPEGWIWIELERAGIVNPRHDSDNETLSSFVPMKLIEEGTGEGHETEVRPWGEIRRGYTHFQEGDVGLAKITPCFQNRKSTVFRNLKNGIGAGTTELYVFRPLASAILPRYVLAFFQSAGFIEEGVNRMTGTAGQQRVPRDYVEQSLLPLPPIEEQRRIVGKVENLMEECDALEARQGQAHEKRSAFATAATHALRTAESEDDVHTAWTRIREHFDPLTSNPENVDDLRQAVLQLAARGRLTERRAEDTPAGEMLEQIQKEKEQLYEAGKIRKPKEIPPVQEGPYPLPEKWEWARFNALAKDIRYGTSQKASEADIGVPVLRMGNIDENGRLHYDDLKYISPDSKDLPKLYLKHGDLVFNRTNSYELVGKTAVFRGQDDTMTLASYLIRVRPLHEWVNADYLNYYMNSPVCRDTQIEPEITAQTNQANFNSTKLRHITVPLPPIEEQNRIVERLDDLLSTFDELQDRLVEAGKTKSELVDAVLSGAVLEGERNKSLVED